MWLIACQDEDIEARWIAERLGRFGLAPIEVVTASQIVYGSTWEHRVTSTRTSTKLGVADGRLIDSDEVDGVLNRLAWLSAAGYLNASAADREYATLELQALAVSWLEGFGDRAINRPAPFGAGIVWRPACYWRALALAAGIKVWRYWSREDAVLPSAGSTALVIDGESIGGGFDGAELARAVDLDLFEASFAIADDGSWELADINPMPALSNGPDAAVAALAGALRIRSGARP